MEATTHLEVFNLSTGESVKKIDVTGKSDRYIFKAYMGLIRNMNSENYGVRELAEPVTSISQEDKTDTATAPQN